MKFKIGDHLVSSRTFYTHHGIYIGNGQVIHYSGLSDGLSAGPIEVTTLEIFSSGQSPTVREYNNAPFQGRNVVTRARTRLGEDKYDLHANNCEHFCSWAVLGSAECSQVEFAEDCIGVVLPSVVAVTRVRKHLAQTHAGNVAKPAIETVGQLAVIAAFPIATPFVVGYKLFKWLSR